MLFILSKTNFQHSPPKQVLSTKLIQSTFLYVIFAAGLKYSRIVGNSQNFLTWLDKWLKPVIRQSSYWNRCYQTTVNGWSSYTFHSYCDGKGPTVTIIRVGKYIFGGYTSLSWTSKWHDQFHLITGHPSSSCESAMIIFRNSRHGEIWEKSLKKNFIKGIFTLWWWCIKILVAVFTRLFSDSWRF